MPRKVALAAARVFALAGPTVLAFFAGGYFDTPREWAGAVAWLGVMIAAACGARVPTGRPALLAMAGLALLAAWTLLSILWAPIAGDAYRAGQIDVLYLGAVIGSAMIFRGPAVRLIEPCLAAGALLVIGYGLSERVLPGVFHFAHSVSAEGRLEQPLTYWNAMGELAAIGFVLCARLAGDEMRPAWTRAAASSAAVPLALGLYISFSRGALFAAFAGLIALAVLAPRRAQATALARVVGAGALAAVTAIPFASVTGLSGGIATREQQGAIVLAALVIVMALSALASLIAARREISAPLRLPACSSLAAAAIILAGLTVAIVLGAHESSRRPPVLSGGATRLVSLQSNRYDYWDVALRAFVAQPVHGVGAGGWSVYWLRWRTISDFAVDAHSLPLQTLAELGVVGLALLVAMVGAIAAAAREALRRSALAAGPAAGLIVYLAHSPLDWDWQMPALTLTACVLAGAVLALTEPRRSVAPRA